MPRNTGHTTRTSPSTMALVQNPTPNRPTHRSATLDNMEEMLHPLPGWTNPRVKTGPGPRPGANDAQGKSRSGPRCGADSVAMVFRIRDARLEDLPAVGRLAGRLVRMHHDFDPARWLLVDGVEAGYARYFASQLGNPATIVLVAEDVDGGEGSEERDRIVGYAYAGLEERSWVDLRDACGRLHDVFVVERARRQGLARSMLLECLRRLTALGAPLAVTTAAWQNQTSQALLRRLGFRPAVIEMAKDLQ